MNARTEIIEGAAVAEELPAAAPGGQLPATAPAAGDIAAVIERVAMNPDIPIERFEKLIELRERMEANQDERERLAHERQAKQAFAAAFAAAQAEITPVVANAKNDHTRSRYARMDAVHRKVKPIVSKHGFGSTFQQANDAPEGYEGLILELMHAAGHTKEYRFNVPVDSAGTKGSTNKTAVQALGSTLTYGRRYALLMAFDVATAFDDKDGNDQSYERISEEQTTELRELMEKHGRDETRFCTYAGVERLEDLRAELFDEAKSRIVAPPKTKAQANDG